MPFADKRFPSRRAITQERAVSHVPMGDERYRQLMKEVSIAFAQADDGEQARSQQRERERQREEWLSQRQAIIAEIVATIEQHGLDVRDLL